MTKTIPLTRRFAPPSDDVLRDPTFRTLLGDTPSGTSYWSDLLTHSPVLVIGEGKCGKTFEFLRQVATLRSEGRYAFFAPLEQLMHTPFIEILSPEDEAQFHAWSASDDPCFIFLDALDELKLRDGAFRNAFNKVRRAIGPNMSRVRLFISCRPGDPTLQFDVEELAALALPKQEQQAAAIREVGEVALIEIVSRSDCENTTTEREETGKDRPGHHVPMIVSLLPLDNSEIRESARLYNPEQADAFCDILDRQELWHLYRVPDDIMKALDYMARHGKFGTLEEQLRASIDEKLSEGIERRSALLALEKAQNGAARIALATIVMQRRTIKVDGTGDADTLSIRDVLSDFTAQEQAELIGKSIFVPNGVGTVQFHHRETQEYLAAQRIIQLHQLGLPRTDLIAMLFANIGGQAVIKTTMEPVAAWLTLSDHLVQAQVLQRKPQLLFNAGLPGSMSLDLKAKVLRSFVGRYKTSAWRLANVGHGKLRQIADPGLGVVVRELWDTAYTGHDAREVLLELIWLAPLSDCSDLALAALGDPALDIGHLTFAGRGVLAAGTQDEKAALKDMCLAGALPEAVIRYLLPDLFPDQMSEDEFWTLIQGMTEVPDTVHGLGYAIYCAVKNEGAATVSLRNRFTTSVWETRSADIHMYDARSDCDYYLDAVFAICAASEPADDDVDAWADAVAIALHFGERKGSIIAREDTKQIDAMMGSSPKLRAAYFWACIRLGDAIEAKEDDWGRFIRGTSELRRGAAIRDGDQDWLLGALDDEETRGIAFEALRYFFYLRADRALAEAVRLKMLEHPDLLERLDLIENPPPREPDKYDLRHKELQHKRAAEEAERVQGWINWRGKVLAEPNFGMDGDGRLNVLYDVSSILGQARNSGGWGHWDHELIARIMSPAFLDRLRAELSQFWRETEVLLRSERPNDKRGTYFNSWLLAHSAVKSEADVEGWANALSPNEIRQATRIACMALSQPPAFFRDLAAANPDIVAEVIAEEAVAQLRTVAETNDAPMLHDVLHHHPFVIKQQVAHRIAPEFSTLGMTEDNALQYGVRLVAEHGSHEDIEIATAAIIKRLDDHPQMFSLLSHLDIARTSELLLERTRDLQTAEARDTAGALFVSVFGDRWSNRVAEFESVAEDRRVQLLKELVIRAYEAVRRDEDQPLTTRRSGGARDAAEGARSALFDRLIATQSVATIAALHELAALPSFSHMSDRLREMSYEVAARVSDKGPMALPVFKALDEAATYTPYDRVTLFQVMNSRLGDFAHDLAHSETSIVDTLRKVDRETELRRFVADWLENRSRGAYSTTQEAVAYDEKRTDIRIHPTQFTEHAAIELKLDDTRHRWSGQALKNALFDQLVGRYLQHETCKVGCLLIVMRETREWQNPDNGEMMSLDATVEWLGSLAEEFITAHPDIFISVQGIDCSA